MRDFGMNLIRIKGTRKERKLANLLKLYTFERFSTKQAENETFLGTCGMIEK